MRYIDLRILLRKCRNWGKKAELWKNDQLKKDFRDYFHNKCWYTEVPLIGQDAPIDHFRPKAAVEQFEKYNYNRPLSECGYYWLKSDPSNYRACCVYANRKTGQGGKGCFFPLSDESPFLTEHGGEDEIPLLLDPCIREDVILISFIGNQVVASSINDLDKMRVKVTEVIYNMVDPYIKAERGKIWENVEKILEEYESGDISRSVCLRQLRDAISRRAPFSACAIACVNSLASDEIKQELNLTL